jgi:hypothetical protein
VWGPVGGVTAINFPISPETPLGGYQITIDCQGSPISSNGSAGCESSRLSRITAASNGGEARISGVGAIVPFTQADVDFYGLIVPEGYPDLTGECPRPNPPNPLPPLPNTAVYSVPNSPPNINFPVIGPACPEETNVLEIRVVYEDGIGPQGPKGDKGDNGENGESTMRRIIKVSQEEVVGSGGAIDGNDILTTLPLDCAYVRIDWLGLINFPRVEYVRRFHESQLSANLDEYQLGRIYLSVENSDGWSSPYIQASKNKTLVVIPDTPGLRHSIVVTDVYGVGVDIVDIGYRYRDFRWENPEDIPLLEYRP